MQEKGQLDQALAYFDVVLQQHPHVQEARLNADMIRRMQSEATPLRKERALPREHPYVQEAPLNADMSHRMQPEVTSTPQRKNGSLPREAELFWYGEHPDISSCDYYMRLKRLPNGRSEFEQGSSWDHERGVRPQKIVFPEHQSHQMWTELLKAIEHGSGLSDTDPTPWGEAQRANGEKMTVKIQGEQDQIYYTDGNSPVDRILEKFLEARR